MKTAKVSLYYSASSVGQYRSDHSRARTSTIAVQIRNVSNIGTLTARQKTDTLRTEKKEKRPLIVLEIGTYRFLWAYVEHVYMVALNNMKLLKVVSFFFGRFI